MENAPVRYEFYPGPVDAAFTAAQRNLQDVHFAERLTACDPGLFASDPTVQKAVANRLGWVNSYSRMRGAVPDLTAFAGEITAAGLNQIVLIGMGGSSLCSEVSGKTYGLPAHLESYIVLDSTAPAAVQTVSQLIDPQQTLFIVASKSGTTVETRSHADFFFTRQKDLVGNPGAHFVAITDAGSVLESWGTKSGFRRIFINPADIGGRFSAISYFGLVPGALLGVNLNVVLDATETAAKTESSGGPAQKMGAFLHACFEQARDKITFLPSPETAPLIPWIEQLLAESTGKEGKGIFPIEGEPPANAHTYGDDRAFVFTRFASEDNENLGNLTAELKASGFPVVEIVLSGRDSLGAAFLQWEWVTSAVGCLLKVNPFDEPNVTESKDNTKRLLAEFEKSGGFPRWPEVARCDSFSISTLEPKVFLDQDAGQTLTTWCAGIQPGDYVALLAYLAADAELEESLANMRCAFRDHLRVATFRGWGPRFLHSIGQLYKGGPTRGHFLIITDRPQDDLAIPGRPYTFGQLINAQAFGDAEALAKRTRPVLHVQLTGDVISAMRTLENDISEAVSIATL